MFGICLLHAIAFGPFTCPWACNILASCVVGFVFISGWFGVKFSWLKLAKLYCIGLYAALVFGLLSWVVGDVDTIGGALLIGWHKLTHGFWFLHAYAVMMILAPMVDALLSEGGAIRIMPFLAMVWIWGFGRTLPFGDALFPGTAGLDAYGGITLTAIYVASQICRKMNVDQKIKTVWLLSILPVLWFLAGVGLGDYNSPFAFALAAVCFFLFKRICLPKWVGRGVILLSPSMFSVYLIHTNEVGTRAIKNMESLMVDACMLRSL